MLLAAALGVHIGAFMPPTRPPGMAMGGSPLGTTGVVMPTRDVSFFTYVDPDVPAVHHFWHIEYTLIKALWAPDTPLPSRPLVLAELSKWYSNATNTSLDASFDDVLDRIAWQASQR